MKNIEQLAQFYIFDFNILKKDDIICDLNQLEESEFIEFIDRAKAAIPKLNENSFRLKNKNFLSWGGYGYKKINFEAFIDVLFSYVNKALEGKSQVNALVNIYDLSKKYHKYHIKKIHETTQSASNKLENSVFSNYEKDIKKQFDSLEAFYLFNVLKTINDNKLEIHNYIDKKEIKNLLNIYKEDMQTIKLLPMLIKEVFSLDEIKKNEYIKKCAYYKLISFHQREHDKKGKNKDDILLYSNLTDLNFFTSILVSNNNECFKASDFIETNEINFFDKKNKVHVFESFLINSTKEIKKSVCEYIIKNNLAMSFVLGEASSKIGVIESFFKTIKNNREDLLPYKEKINAFLTNEDYKRIITVYPENLQKIYVENRLFFSLSEKNQLEKKFKV